MLSDTLLHLLDTCKTAPVQTFRYFPDVIIAGKEKLEKEDLAYLLEEGFLCQTKHDSFGGYLELTPKAMQLLIAKE